MTLLREKYQLDYAPENDLEKFTIGATEALSTTLTAILEEGDKSTFNQPLLIQATKARFVNSVGAEIVEIDTTENGFVT